MCNAAVSVLYNVLELKSDSIKLTYAVRRPASLRARNIGTWQNVLLMQIILAAFTNTMMFGFASFQVNEPGKACEIER